MKSRICDFIRSKVNWRQGGFMDRNNKDNLADAISLLAREIHESTEQRKRDSESLRLLSKLVTKQDLKEMEERIMKELDELSTEVEETNTIIQSAIVLIKGVSQLIKDAGTNATKLKTLTDSLDSKNKELAQAVLENTPANPPA